MTLAEVRVIRERQSLETVGMTADELRAYFAKGASEAQRMIDEIRKNARESQSKIIGGFSK